ncbi:MAG: CDGSH iron-sulfur domain-containing protein [Methanomassiliicoccales archaeon]
MTERNAGAGKVGARIKVSKDGPYLVEGTLPIAREIIVRDGDQIPTHWKRGEKLKDEEGVALCRCGGSADKPFCDGAHNKNGFNGTETALKGPYSQAADLFEGPGIDLADDEELCSRLQFCHRAGGVWQVVEERGDDEACTIVREIAGNCASGRLLAVEKEGTPYEPKFKMGVGVVEDPSRRMSGPLWISGGVPIISSDGVEYEVRNRVTLCRCGRSGNKPFCDGTHVDIKFRDGTERG